MADQKISQLTAATVPLAGTEAIPLVQSSTKKIAASDLMKRTFDDFGVNTNPSAWASAFTGVDIGAGGSQMADATSYYQGSNWFWSGAAYVYKNTGPAIQTIYTGTGEYIVANAPSGTAGNAASFTNRLYMYSEGTLGLKTGNLQFETAGKGIDFSANASAAGMTSELLNDYEEGTWTPTVTTESGGSGQVYTKQSGRYTKIGRQVVAGFEMTLSDKGTLSGTYIIIGGLPFSAAGTGSDLDAGALFVSFFAGLAVNQIFLAGYAVASSGAWVTTSDAAGASMDNLRVTDIGNTFRLAGTIVYTTA